MTTLPQQSLAAVNGEAGVPSVHVAIVPEEGSG